MVFDILGKTFSDMDVGQQKRHAAGVARISRATGQAGRVPFGSNQPSVVL
jgi:hypothetical protein